MKLQAAMSKDRQSTHGHNSTKPVVSQVAAAVAGRVRPAHAPVRARAQSCALRGVLVDGAGGGGVVEREVGGQKPKEIPR